MAVDPTGFDKAIAAIQPGALSERQQRIAAGMALARDGMPGYKAAQKVGIPWSTLWRYINGMRQLGNAAADGMEADTTALHETSVDMSLMAAERIRDSLAQEPDEWKPQDLVRVYAAATDRVIALGQQGRAQDDGGASMLQKMLQGHRVKLEPIKAGDDAVDVDAERVG